MLFCFLALLTVGAAPFWLVALVIARDVAIAGGALLLKTLNLELRVEPLAIGKATTAALVGYVGIILLLLAFDRDAPHLVKAGGYAVAALALLSGVMYMHLFLRADDTGSAANQVLGAAEQLSSQSKEPAGQGQPLPLRGAGGLNGGARRDT